MNCARLVTFLQMVLGIALVLPFDSKSTSTENIIWQKVVNNNVMNYPKIRANSFISDRGRVAQNSISQSKVAIEKEGLERIRDDFWLIAFFEQKIPSPRFVPNNSRVKSEKGARTEFQRDPYQWDYVEFCVTLRQRVISALSPSLICQSNFWNWTNSRPSPFWGFGPKMQGRKFASYVIM